MVLTNSLIGSPQEYNTVAKGMGIAVLLLT
jgi:hypothetical protein